MLVMIQFVNMKILEKIPNDELQTPDVHFLFFEVLVVFDHLEQKVYLVASPQKNGSSLEELQVQLTKT